jgi:PPM family protein phosphatase
MKIADAAGLTDPGRRRRRNEDAFVLDPPLFVVADGMGGAQAGEVASRLAASAFREYHEADELEPEARVAAIIQEANRRIYARARSDTQASGMGTTLTAALAEGERIAIGHVGDSRAYRLRGGVIEQLTQDHSLVADLMRSGRLTPEEADTHPQRSVITRALGTDPEVDVDTFTIEPESGDVFVICSDGLSTMVDDDEIIRIVGKSGDLESAARALIKSANRSGGEDNITVVLFTFLDEPAAIDDTLVASGNGQGSEQDLEDTLSGLEAEAVRRAAAEQTAAEEAAAEPGGWTPADEESRPEEEHRRRWARPAVIVLLIVAVLVALLALALWGLSRANFIGADEDGNVVVYQGLPYDLGGGISLYRARYVSNLQAVQLTPAERDELFDHDLIGYDDARDRLAQYEEDGVP